MNLLTVFAILLSVRLASVFLVKTYYVPDEYWQSLEVAHKLTFGYGYLTWEWIQGIRSYIYPGIIAAVYKLLALIKLDNVEFLVIIPRILQAILSAYSDCRFYIWTGKKKWALFLTIMSWFWFYTGSRTLANTLEASLTTIGLSYFPWHGESTTYLWPAAVCCFLRPTAAIIWAPLCIYHIKKSELPVSELVLKRFLMIGSLVAALCVGIDSYWYGKLIITPYEFLKYNIIENIGDFYGTHPWYWYFITGLPCVLGINYIPFILAATETLRYRKAHPVRIVLLITIAISLCALSVVGHKEFRFVSCLLPLCFYIITDYLSKWSLKASNGVLWLTALIIIAFNFIPAWYLSTHHQKGPLELMPKLQNIAKNYRDESSRRASILFLMPCHSTPYYSHIHENVTMRFLTCEPNFQKMDSYKDEADQFFDSPVHWLRSHVPAYPPSAMPTHVVLYEPLESNIYEFLRNYKLLEKIDNIADYDNAEPLVLLDNLSHQVKEGKINVDSLLQPVRRKTSKNILIYQRLRKGEENSFNHDDLIEESNGYGNGDRDEDYLSYGEETLEVAAQSSDIFHQH